MCQDWPIADAFMVSLLPPAPKTKGSPLTGPGVLQVHCGHRPWNREVKAS